jgi:hypothetical protein
LRGAAELAFEPLLADPALWVERRGSLSGSTKMGLRRVVA